MISRTIIHSKGRGDSTVFTPQENKPTLQFLTSPDKLKAAIYYASISQYRAAPMRPVNAAAAATTTQSRNKKGENIACPRQQISSSLVVASWEQASPIPSLGRVGVATASSYWSDKPFVRALQGDQVQSSGNTTPTTSRFVWQEIACVSSNISTI